MKNLKILHLNNVAEVGKIISNQQIISGLDSEFIDLVKPLSSSNFALKLLSLPIRFAHALLLRIKISLGSYDIIHVHYTTSALFFLGIKSRLVVHVHGSDVRDQDKSKFRFLINKIVFKYSDLIFYSTPDLKIHLDKYEVTAIFAANPLDIENFNETQLPLLSIFIHASISQIKGATILIEAIKKIQYDYPGVKISYLGFGDTLDDIEKLKLNKMTKVKRENLKSLISSHGLILGQFKVGAIGMSELEALACNRPVVCHFEYDHVYKTPSPFLKAKTADEIYQHVKSYLENPTSFLIDKEKYRAWVIENHSKEKIERLIYNNYLNLF